MLRSAKISIATLAIALSGTTVLVSFQNCGNQVAFESSQLAGPSANASGGSTTGSTNGGDTANVDATTGSTGSTGMTPTCTGGQVAVGNVCACPGDKPHWTGVSCIGCADNQEFDSVQNKCMDRCLLPNQYWHATDKKCVQCAAGETWEGTRCAKITAECSSYTEITTNGTPFVIPARTSQKICFYVKVFNLNPSRSSQSSRSQALDVISADHSNGVQPREAKNPLVLGDKSVSFQLQGERSIVLNSIPDASSTTVVSVDNFVLFSSVWSGQTTHVAAGTSDSLYTDAENKYGGGSGIFVMNGQAWTKAQFTAYGSGGTSQIGDIKYNQTLPIGVPIDIRVRALDCGGAEYSSNGYLIFR